jgi:hypothetical protein
MYALGAFRFGSAAAVKHQPAAEDQNPPPERVRVSPFS